MLYNRRIWSRSSFTCFWTIFNSMVHFLGHYAPWNYSTMYLSWSIIWFLHLVFNKETFGQLLLHSSGTQASTQLFGIWKFYSICQIVFISFGTSSYVATQKGHGTLDWCNYCKKAQHWKWDCPVHPKAQGNWKSDQARQNNNDGVTLFNHVAYSVSTIATQAPANLTARLVKGCNKCFSHPKQVINHLLQQCSLPHDYYQHNRYKLLATGFSLWCLMSRIIWCIHINQHTPVKPITIQPADGPLMGTKIGITPITSSCLLALYSIYMFLNSPWICFPLAS